MIKIRDLFLIKEAASNRSYTWATPVIRQGLNNHKPQWPHVQSRHNRRISFMTPQDNGDNVGKALGTDPGSQQALGKHRALTHSELRTGTGMFFPVHDPHTALTPRCCHYAHFTKEEPEARGCQVPCQRLHNQQAANRHGISPQTIWLQGLHSELLFYT